MSVFNFNDKKRLTEWEKDRKRREKISKEYEQKGVPSKERISVKYENPKFVKKKGSQDGGKYNWDRNMLQDLPSKSYGRSYNKKFNKLADEAGIPKSERFQFRKWLDSKEDGEKTTLDTANKRAVDDMAQLKNQQEKTDKALAKVKKVAKKKEATKAEFKKANTKPMQRQGLGAGSQGAGSDMGTKESRFASQSLNAFTADLPKQALIRKMKENPEDTSLQAKYDEMYGGEGKKSDIVAQLLGYGAGGLLGGGAIRGTALGAKGVGSLLGKKLTKESAKQVAKQTAKEGAVVGGLMAGAEVGSREALNGEDYDWKQNASKIGIEAGAGAVLDPLLTLAKPAFKGASQSAVDKMLKPMNDELLSKALPKIGDELMPQYDILKELVKRGNTSNIPSAPDFSDISRARADISPENKMAGDMILRPRNPELSSIEPAFRDRADLNVNPRDLGSINRQMSPEELAGRSMMKRNMAGEAPAQTPEIGMQGFGETPSVQEILGLPSPKTIYRPRQPLGQDVDVPEGLALNAPKDTTPLTKKLEMWRDPSNPIGDTEIRDMYKTMQEVEEEIIQTGNLNHPNTWKLFDEYEQTDPIFKLKRMELEETRSYLQDVMNREQEWKAVKESQETFATKNRPEEMKFIVPKDASLDYEGVPKRFRGTKNSASMDIYEASSVAGYDSVDDYIKYLQGVDKLLSQKRKDFNLPPYKGLTASIKKERNLEKEMQKVLGDLTGREEKKALLDELSGMMKPREGADPLQFKKQIGLHPQNLAYNAGMHPNERMATKVERIEPEPEMSPYEAKRQKVMFTNQERGSFDKGIKEIISESPDEVAVTIDSVVPEGKVTPSQVMDAVEKDPEVMRSFFQKSADDKSYSDTIINTLVKHPFKRFVNKAVEGIARQGQGLKVYSESTTKDYLAHAQKQLDEATDPIDRLYWDNQVTFAKDRMNSVKKDGGYALEDFENEKASGEIVKTILAKPTQQLAELSRISKVPTLQLFEVQIAKRLKWANEFNPNFKASQKQLEKADELLANLDPVHEKAQAVFRDIQMKYLDVLESTEYIDASRRAKLEEDIFYIPFSRDKSWTNKLKANVAKPMKSSKRKGESYQPTGRSRDVSFEGLKEFEGGSDKDYFKNPMEAWLETLVGDVGSAMRNRTHNRILELADMEEALGTENFAKRISREDFEKLDKASSKDSPFRYITAINNGEKVYMEVQQDLLETLQQNDIFSSENLFTKMTGLVATAKVTSPSYLFTAVPRDLRQAWQNSESKGLGIGFWTSLWKVATDKALAESLQVQGMTFSKGNNPYSSSQGGMNIETVQKEIDAKFMIDGKKDPKGAIKRLNERFNYVHKGLRAIGKISDDLPRMAEANLVKKRWENGKLGEARKRVAELEELMQGQNTDSFEGNPEDIMKLNFAKQQVKDAERNMQTEMLYRGRDVMNYTQEGSMKSAKWIKKYLMFANTATVSKHKTARSFMRDPIGFSLKYATISAPLIYASNQAYDALEQSDKDHFDAIPDYVKNQRYLIPLGDREYISLPRVHELAIIENYLEAGLGMQDFRGANQTAIKELAPLQSGNILQALVPNPDGVISSTEAVLPSTGISPFIDTLLNKKTTFNQKEVSYDKDAPDTYTSDVSKKLLGGIDILPNAPDTADYLVKQIGGDYGRTGLSIADLLMDRGNEDKQDALTRVLNPAQDYKYKKYGGAWREMYLDSVKKKALEDK